MADLRAHNATCRELLYGLLKKEIMPKIWVARLKVIKLVQFLLKGKQPIFNIEPCHNIPVLRLLCCLELELIVGAM